MYKGGYMGKVLRVNLTTGDITTEKLPEDIAKDFIGGAGFGIKYLFDEVPGDTDPLGEDNKLIFASGPLSGTNAPCASRMALVTKSPLTSAVGLALSGGYFPVELKFAGYDVLIIEGKSEEPVYLTIKDDKVALKKATKLWGLDTLDTQEVLKQDLRDLNTRIACIGPAGENLSKMAAIINERRAFGRKGVGAVMGSKKLKAIAIRGTQEVPIADDKAYGEARKKMLGYMKESPVLYPQFSKLGTPMVVDVTSALGIFPSENYRNTGEDDYVESLGAETSIERTIGNEHCYGCPVGCTQMKIARGDASYLGTMSDPEYETYYSLGSQTGVKDHDAVIFADRLCDRLGLDTISVGVTIGLAMELYEDGKLTKDDTNGWDFKFGNHKAMNAAISELAFRRDGLGALLCDGSKVLAEKIGQGAQDIAMHVKGLEFPAYDPRGAKAHGLNYATCCTGADHNRGYSPQEIFGAPVPEPVDRFSPEKKGWLTVWNQDLRCATADCATMCGFLIDMALAETAEENMAAMVGGATGLDI
ncbi:MAG TPA: ABC transporter ATP-binding protein, partial [Eubacteriaceae bacterium]|nr:ABC transporter ATP-binding protein [Eubacteriaceae bacterium]